MTSAQVNLYRQNGGGYEEVPISENVISENIANYFTEEGSLKANEGNIQEEPHLILSAPTPGFSGITVHTVQEIDSEIERTAAAAREKKLKEKRKEDKKNRKTIVSC